MRLTSAEYFPLSSALNESAENPAESTIPVRGNRAVFATRRIHVDILDNREDILLSLLKAE